MHLSGADFGWRYLYLLNDGLELRRTISPLFQQLHGLVEILHVLCVHLEEGCEFLQDVSDARCGRPAGRERGKAGLVRPEVVAPALQSVGSVQRENVNAAECCDSELCCIHSHFIPAEAHHSPMRFSRSGSRNWLWKVWMEEMLEKMFFTTSTGNVPLFASSISLRQNT